MLANTLAFKNRYRPKGQLPSMGRHKEASGRKRSKRTAKVQEQELFRVLTAVETDAFIADVSGEWRTSAELARFSVAAVPPAHKNAVILSHCNSLCEWLFRRVRASILLRYKLGRNINPAAFVKMFGWASDDVATDLTMAIFPEGAGWRYVAGHSKAGERVEATDKARIEDIEEIHYSLVDQGVSFYDSAVRAWLRRASAGWEIDTSRTVGHQSLRELSPFTPSMQGANHEVCRYVSRDVAAAIALKVEAAHGFAHDYVLALALAASSTSRAAKAGSLKKQQDMSQYLNGSELTDRQRQCASLKFEYALNLNQIAKRVGIHRTTVEEHIEAAKIKMQNARGAERRRNAVERSNLC
jgi:DNA-directed RNA polymerase specialized sigma24 family protein